MDALNSLGVNFTAVLFHILNFIILLVVLQKFLFKPITNMLDQRAARIRESMENVEAQRAETARLQAESRDILDQARQEGQQLLAQANRNAERILTEARQAAQQEGERLVERARTDLARERAQAFDELRQQIGDLAIQAASQVVRRSLDLNDHRELLREFVTTAAGPTTNGGGDGDRTMQMAPPLATAPQAPPRPPASSPAPPSGAPPSGPTGDQDRTVQMGEDTGTIQLPPDAGEDDSGTIQLPRGPR
jgi:F-type H+-transporting ATPase subunit b